MAVSTELSWEGGHVHIEAQLPVRPKHAQASVELLTSRYRRQRVLQRATSHQSFRMDRDAHRSRPMQRVALAVFGTDTHICPQCAKVPCTVHFESVAFFEPHDSEQQGEVVDRTRRRPHSWHRRQAPLQAPASSAPHPACHSGNQAVGCPEEQLLHWCSHSLVDL